MIDRAHLSKALTERFGLEIDVSTLQAIDGQKITISPCGIESTISFRIELLLGWRTVTANFIPGNFATGLVRGIKSASKSQRAAFATFSDSLKSKGAEISIFLDQQHAVASDPASWPENWTFIQISMKKTGGICVVGNMLI